MDKILIVDDLQVNRKLLKKMIKSFRDCDVIEANDGDEAIQKFTDEMPDLILMDVNMPVMNGYESATKIKSLATENHVPIIFITALSTEDSLSESLASGGDDFISKPFSIELLGSKLNAHLRIRELTKKLNDKNEELKIYNQRLEYEQLLIENYFDNALKQCFLDENIIKFHLSSMSTFSGDLFLAERKPNGGLILMVGDFSGHGLTAAMGTLPVSMVFFKMVKHGFSIDTIAYEFNRHLNMLMPTNMFFAVTLLELNAECDKIKIWMGSMPECYIIADNGKIKETIKSENLPIGVLSDTKFEAQYKEYDVVVGDKIYLHTDGVIEAENTKHEMFGEKRLEEILTSNKLNRYDKVLSELDDFTGNRHQSDDITLVELTCNKVPGIQN